MSLCINTYQQAKTLKICDFYELSKHKSFSVVFLFSFLFMLVLGDNFSELLLLSLDKVTYINGELLFVTELWTIRGKHQKLPQESLQSIFFSKRNFRQPHYKMRNTFLLIIPHKLHSILDWDFLWWPCFGKSGCLHGWFHKDLTFL